MTNSKVCTYCKTTQPLSEFRKAPNSRDKLSWRCKSCLSAQYKEYRKRVPKVASEKDKARQKAAQLANPEKYRLARAAWYQANKDKHREQHKKWLANRPGKNAEMVREYHARKNGNETFLVTLKDLRRLRQKPCYYCQSKVAGTMDHVMPVSRGGRHSIGNLVPACQSCNSRKRNKLLIIWRIEKGEFK